MKKTLVFLIVALLGLTTFAKPVDLNTARRVAENFWQNETTGEAAGKTVQRIGNSNFIEISNRLGVSEMYVFNCEDNHGFVIVAADDIASPILGYSTINGIDREGRLPENLRWWLQGYAREISEAREAGYRPSEETTAEWKNLINGTPAPKAPGAKNVDALIQTHWDQDSPFNNLCPLDNGSRSMTGCVATAMAQVMRYWNWPTQGTGSHSYSCSTTSPTQTLSVNFGSTTYDWDNMPTTSVYGWNNTQKTAVATLMYHCGVSVDMSYTADGSGAYDSQVDDALLNYFGYAAGAFFRMKQTYTGNWTQLIQNELDNYRPVIYGGTDSDGSGGHCFVCDGYNSSNQFHFNWGWSGYGDGFFSLTSLTPSPGGIGGGNYNFSYFQDAITGISSPNGNPDTAAANTYDLATYNNFTVSSPVALGSNITGSVGIANLGPQFVGYLGVAAYSGNNLVAMLLTDSYDTMATNVAWSYNISKRAASPLVAGTYTAKAVYSLDGTNWTPITTGYNNCPTSVTFTITDNGGSTPTGNYALYTYQTFTINSPITYGSTITGTCKIANAGDGPFEGYLGVAAYSGSSLVDMLYQTSQTDLDSMMYMTLNISKAATSPLIAGNYTAKAVYSTNGSTWTPITTGLNNCPTSVNFRINEAGNNPDPGTQSIDEADLSSLNIYSHANSIVIAGANDLPVMVYDYMGHVVFRGTAESDQFRVAVPARGLYLVRIANAITAKIMVY